MVAGAKLIVLRILPIKPLPLHQIYYLALAGSGCQQITYVKLEHASIAAELNVDELAHPELELVYGLNRYLHRALHCLLPLDFGAGDVRVEPGLQIGNDQSLPEAAGHKDPSTQEYLAVGERRIRSLQLHQVLRQGVVPDLLDFEG